MAGWREKAAAFKTSLEAAAAREVPKTADEFVCADELDQDVEANEESTLAMERALEHLRGRHLAFRRPEKCQECDLDELRLEILTAVTSSPELEDYYHEAWDSGADPRLSRVSSGAASSVVFRRIAVMQLELMTRAFYVLQLQLFGNAPENHGWMSLFRSWGRSPRFNQVFDELQATLAPEFAKFYLVYVRNLRARASAYGHLPIHHPWLKPAEARGRGLYMDSGIVEAEIEVEVRPGAGGVTDQRGSEKADQAFEKPSDAPPSGGSEGPGSNE